MSNSLLAVRPPPGLVKAFNVPTRHIFHHQPIRAHPFSTTIAKRSILGLDRNTKTMERLKSHHAIALKEKLRNTQKFKVPPTPEGYRQICPEPMKTMDEQQRLVLDPTGARKRLFDPLNIEGAKVGDILLVRQKSGDPFAGVCINIRRRGVDTGILLRNQLTRVGVEMWFKVYSPNVQGIEIVQRRRKRARRARLYYMRQPKHDVGSVEKIVQQYIRQRQALRSGERVKGRDADSHRRHGKKNKSK